MSSHTFLHNRNKFEASKTIFGAILLFFVCITLFLMMRNNIWFMDEMDNFSIGLQMTQGGTLYTTLFSQHMPLMYYICAFFAKLGARSVISFRLCWYVFLSLCYVLMYLRYNKFYGRVAMFLLPVFYLFSITSTYLATSILAEQLQAIGMTVLLLEFIMFAKTLKVSKFTAVCIAIAINISFLSAFVSAFGIFAIVIGFVALEIYTLIKQKQTFKNSIIYLLKKYSLTIILTLAPMALLGLYFVINGMWNDFFYKAILFNTSVYSDYQGGFGSSPISAFIGCFTQYIDWFKAIIQTLFQGFAAVSPQPVLLFIAQYAFLAILLFKKQFFSAFIIELFFVFCGSRGFYNFHNLQGFMLNCAMLAIICAGLWKGFISLLRKVKTNKKYTLRCLSTGLAFLAILGVFFTVNGKFFYEHRMSILPTEIEFNPQYEQHSNEALINLLTDENEYILQNINREDYFLQTHVRAPSYNTAPSPWWWLATKEESMAQITQNPPRVAIYDPMYTAFGEYVVKDFAKELDDFINENYTQLVFDNTEFYVHNSYLNEALSKLPQNSEDMVGSIKPNSTCGDALANGSVSQSFVATRSEMKTLSIQFGTHSRPYTGSIEVVLTNSKGDAIAAWQINGKDIVDNEFTFVLQSEHEPIALSIGEEYTVTLNAHHKNEKDNNITVWAYESPETPSLLRIKIR